MVKIFKDYMTQENRVFSLLVLNSHDCGASVESEIKV